METTILNRQRSVPVDRDGLRSFLDRLTERLPAGEADAWSLALVSDQTPNSSFR